MLSIMLRITGGVTCLTCFLRVKSAVDGLVDAGVLKDDSDRYVVSLEMLRGEGIVTGGQLIIEVIDVGDSV